jgi:Fe-S oxidoreductase
LKARFLALYHTRYLRSGRDYLTGNIEILARWQSRFPGFANAIAQNAIMQWGMKQLLGLVDPPIVSSQTLQQGLAARQAPTFDILQLSNFSEAERANSVILIQDAFTSFYEVSLVLDTYDFLTRLGYSVYVAPFFASGKPLHVRGFLREFQAIATKNIAYLTQLAQLDIPLIGIEPSIVLTYRDEYAKLLNKQGTFRVQLLQEFLVTQTDRLRSHSPQGQKRSQPQNPLSNSPYYLLTHCTEKTAALESQKQWQQVFQAIGLDLTLGTTGCCGMAGIYGHEAEHYESSKGIYQMSWEQYLPSNTDERPRFLVTGYSCRSQVQRFAGWVPQHPVQVLGGQL